MLDGGNATSSQSAATKSRMNIDSGNNNGNHAMALGKAAKTAAETSPTLRLKIAVPSRKTKGIVAVPSTAFRTFAEIRLKPVIFHVDASNNGYAGGQNAVGFAAMG